MSRWLVLCLECDAWSTETDDAADGCDKAEAHLEVCDGRITDPFEGVR